jgi:hypothetical protein
MQESSPDPKQQDYKTLSAEERHEVKKSKLFSNMFIGKKISSAAHPKNH